MLADTETNVTLYYVQNTINSKSQKFGALNLFFDRNIILTSKYVQGGCTGWLVFLKLTVISLNSETCSGQADISLSKPQFFIL